jgi:hypothetical protein
MVKRLWLTSEYLLHLVRQRERCHYSVLAFEQLSASFRKLRVQAKTTCVMFDADNRNTPYGSKPRSYVSAASVYVREHATSATTPTCLNCIVHELLKICPHKFLHTQLVVAQHREGRRKGDLDKETHTIVRVGLPVPMRLEDFLGKQVTRARH